MSAYEVATLTVALVAAALASWFAWRANKIAVRSRRESEEANRIALEANRIARESNEIADRANARVESLEREKIEFERAAIVTIGPVESPLMPRDPMHGYYPFQIANSGKARANGVKVRWWMMYALDRDRMLRFLLSESFPLGDIRQDESALATLYLYIPPTSQSVDIRFQLSWDDHSGERYHHSEFVFWFRESKVSRERIPTPFFVGAYLDGKLHPTYQGRIERQQSCENLEKLTERLSRQTQANASTDWTRLRTSAAFET